ncbi:YbaN family protein [Marinimicrobium alkaliphilum]|uniref:YbaN family protein n=1 Tax=Marinimicrobium alkaliphilum TaxID=2202654 RepID=UPI000DB94D2C|nr:YbaN family protein [Marinimicrobium alkaliphilum]
MLFHRRRLFVRLRRLPWQCLTWGCVGLGAAGTIVPLLPTTPFLLVAAWAAPKGSPRLGRWLLAHPRFGPVLLAWRHERAVPPGAKRLALLLLAASWATLWWLRASPWVLAFTAVLFVAVASFLLTRPNPGKHLAPPSPSFPPKESLHAHR